MIPTRATTAQIAQEILSDFYLSSNNAISSQKLKQKHDMRVYKRQRQVLLSHLDPLDQQQQNQQPNELPVAMSVSKSMSSLPKRSVKFASDYQRKDDVDDGTGSVTSLQSRASSSASLKHRQQFGGGGSSSSSGAINTDDYHAVPGMMHRAVYNSSSSSNQADAQQTMSEEDRNAYIAANAREVQLGAMQDSAVMQQIMREVLDLNKEVTGVVKELHHRKELGGKVEYANTTYVRLFERMLAEVLLIQRSKFKSQSKSMQDLRVALAESKSKEQSNREKTTIANASANRMEMEVAELKSCLASREKELEGLLRRVDDLEIAKSFLEKKFEGMGKNGISKADEQKLINQIRKEEKMLHIKETQELRKKWLKEMEKEMKKLGGVDGGKGAAGGGAGAGGEGTEGGEKMSLSDMISSSGTVSDFKRPKVDGSSQTEVDEYGLWDKQDGWTMPISGTRVARQRWKEAIRFVKCPHCKGIGNFVAMAAKMIKQLTKGGSDVLNQEGSDKPRGKTGAVWQIPDELVRFMSQLPRTVIAINPLPMSWAVRRVWTLINLKRIADDQDEHLGYAVQPFNEFLVENYLTRCEKRSDAELAMYLLLTTLQELHLRHPLLHTFSRFVGVLDGMSVEEMQAYAIKLAEIAAEKRAKKKKEEFSKMNARDRTKAAELEKEFLRKDKEKRELKTNADEEQLPQCDHALSGGILTVYNYARNCLLTEYQGVYESAINKMKETVPLVTEFETKLNKEPEEWECVVPKHICVDSKYHFYVPLDRAMRVLQCVVSFLDDKQYQASLRSMEANIVFLTNDGELYLPDGMHTLVRQTIREFASIQSEDGADYKWQDVYDQLVESGRAPPRDEEELGPITLEEIEKDKCTMMVNMDSLLRTMCEALLYRSKYVQKRLAEIFIEGDDNGDGVLSFQEFTHIVAKVAPHFNTRRILKMFREALMQGEDNDSIGSSAFVSVCRNYGLVQLININDLRDGSLKALSFSEEQKREKKERDAMAALAAATAAAAASASSLFSSGYKNPQERAAAKKNGSGLIALRKAYSQGNIRKQSVLLSPMSNSSNMHLINVVKKVANSSALPLASSIASDGDGDAAAAAAAAMTMTVATENANANLLPSPIASPLANLFQKLKESSSPIEQSPISAARSGKSPASLLRSLASQKLAEEGPDDSESDVEGSESEGRKSTSDNNNYYNSNNNSNNNFLLEQVHARQPPPFVKPVDTSSFLKPNIEVDGARGHHQDQQQQQNYYHSPYDADEGSHLHGRLSSDEPPAPVTGLLVREQLRLRREQRQQQKHARVQAQSASFAEMKERELMAQDEDEEDACE